MEPISVGQAGPRPGMLRHPIKRFRDTVRFIYGRKSNTNFIRLFPNPGFMLTIGKTEIKYSVFRGFSKRTL